MQVKCDVLVNIIDNTQRVFLVPMMNSKFVDQVEFLPVFESAMHPKLQWVRKDAYKKKGTEMVEVNA